MIRYFLSISLLALIFLALATKADNKNDKSGTVNEALKVLRTERWNITDAHVAKICSDKSLTQLDLSGCQKITHKWQG